MAVTVALPPGTSVYITAFTNAAYLQKATITPPAGPAVVWQGAGEGNRQIGQQIITTAAGSQNQNYTVAVQYSTNNGASWQDSSLLPGGATLGTMNLSVVLSEDHADRDFNDAVVQFMWWTPLN
jgi:hypothetical protein